jgi:hypothetical protein
LDVLKPNMTTVHGSYAYDLLKPSDEVLSPDISPCPHEVNAGTNNNLAVLELTFEEETSRPRTAGGARKPARILGQYKEKWKVRWRYIACRGLLLHPIAASVTRCFSLGEATLFIFDCGKTW